MMAFNEERATLVSAMRKDKRLVQMSFVRLDIQDPASANAQWCLEQYFAELNERFENGLNRAAVLPDEPEELRPPAGVFLIAKLHQHLVGCGGVKLHGRAPAELKRMWVSPAARGLGIGRRLLEQLELHAHDAGATAVRLETNRGLREAISLYRRSGYVEWHLLIRNRTHITGSRSDLKKRKAGGILCERLAEGLRGEKKATGRPKRWFLRWPHEP